MFNNYWSLPFNPPIPTEFSNEFSYYEDVRSLIKAVKLLKKHTYEELRKIWEEYYRHEDVIVRKLKEYINTQDKNYSIEAKRENEQLKIELKTSMDKTHYEINLNMAHLFDNCMNAIHQLELHFTTIFNKMTDENRLFFGKISEMLEGYGSQIENILKEFNVRWNSLDDTMASLIAENAEFRVTLQEDLENQIWRELDEIKRLIIENTGDSFQVFNPATGKYDSLNDALSDIYNKNIYDIWSFTAEEFDSALNITAEVYDNRTKVQIINPGSVDPVWNYPLTAKAYDDYGKLFFFNELWTPGWEITLNEIEKKLQGIEKEFIKRVFGRDPVTGKMNYIYDMILNLADLHRDSLTAHGYDLIELTAEGYDNHLLTGFDYDYRSAALLT